MQVMRVEAEGLTTSFRYPHFLVGRQPTFRMPPPATIYGHICSAVGDFMDPRGLQFAYVFRYAGVQDDLELLHLATVAGGRLPGPGGYPKNLDVITNPLPREVLLYPRLTLYVVDDSDRLESLVRAFREPCHAVTLGRSQDLMAYREVTLVELEQTRHAYVEHTLLPWTFRLRTGDGIGVTMPRFVDPRDRGRVVWSPFIVLQARLRTAGATDQPGTGVLSPGDPDEQWWVDPTAPELRGRRRGVVWHRFVSEGVDGFTATSASATLLG
jgi:CRISPR-associated protein Cas5t